MIKVVRENIVKYLPLAIPLVAVIAVFVMIRVVLGTPVSKLSPTKGVSEQTLPETAKNLTDSEERIRTLEEVVAILIQKVNSLDTSGEKTNFNSAGTPAPALDSSRLKTLETTVNDLKSRVAVLESPTVTPTPATAATTKYPVYIPMGTSYSLNNDNWTTVDAFEVAFDPADYPGYSGVQLEVSMRALSTLGKAYARLYNNSDSSIVSSTEISTTSDKFVLVSSSSVKLAGGKKYYRVQVKSQANDAFFENPKLKINF